MQNVMTFISATLSQSRYFNYYQFFIIFTPLAQVNTVKLILKTFATKKEKEKDEYVLTAWYLV